MIFMSCFQFIVSYALFPLCSHFLTIFEQVFSLLITMSFEKLSQALPQVNLVCKLTARISGLPVIDSTLPLIQMM